MCLGVSNTASILESEHACKICQFTMSLEMMPPCGGSEALSLETHLKGGNYDGPNDLVVG